jgi:hypothetical protein
VDPPRQIPPGSEGKFTVRVNTAGYGGDRLRKSVVVYTNDPVSPVFTLSISGDVEAFAEIQPARALLQGAGDSPVFSQVRIVPKADYPFRVLETTARIGENIRFRLDADNEDGPFTLHVENLQKTAGRYNDLIVLKTNSSVHPEIKVHVIGNIQ